MVHDINKNRRVAFYPCCANDFKEPLKLLSGLADEVWFCGKENWHRPPASVDPKARFIRADVRDLLDCDLKFDIFFYRHDSMGEGGSAVPLLNGYYLKKIIQHFPRSGGKIITDGSNSFGHFIRKGLREQGYSHEGWGFRLTPNHDHPTLGKAWLKVLNVTF